jgi:hypothetical protein
VATYRSLRGLWRPPVETFEAIATALGAHWRAAARAQPGRIFWERPVSWLRTATVQVVSVTTSPGAAGSSGKPQDPRPY